MDQQTLKARLSYAPDTGEFTWVNPTSPSIPAGTVAGERSGPYTRIRLKGTHHYAHRLAFLYMQGALPTEGVDHINGNKADNRWSNLRPATNTVNGRNMKKARNNTSGVTGVFLDRGKWRAQIKIDGKNLQLGSYTEISDAISARKSAEKEHGFHPNHGRKTA
jgi:hypothetical protein